MLETARASLRHVNGKTGCGQGCRGFIGLDLPPWHGNPGASGFAEAVLVTGSVSAMEKKAGSLPHGSGLPAIELQIRGNIKRQCINI